jgi:hypothetical protein
VSDLWFEASRDVEAETATRALTTAKIATVGVWPFLSVAESDEEFELRLDYAMPRLASLVEGDTLDALLASLREDWKALRDFPEGARSPHTASSDDDDDEGDPDCDEFREDGSCIHSDHMAQADAKKYRSEKKANMATPPSRTRLPLSRTPSPRETWTTWPRPCTFCVSRLPVAPQS